MENIINRHRNLTILAAVLFAQILGLAVQVKRGTDQGTSRLIRIWAVSAITPIEKGVGHTSRWFADTWHNYLYLRGVRSQNRELRGEIEHMRLEQVRMSEDAGQARRLQSLLGFREEFISQTMPAQVISTTGSEFSRGVFIDKGSRDGIKADMPVITPDGIVGKVFRVYPTSSLVLEINDSSSGAGVILEKSRLQGILKGSPTGQTFVANIMADEKIEPGERILTSGGDRVYPKGMAVGTVSRVNPAGTFLNVEVKPSAQLNRLEEVLVITKIVEKAPEANDQSAPVRAIDILAQRLPSVPPPKPAPQNKAPATAQPKPAGTTANPNAEAASPAAVPPETAGQASTKTKPAPSAEKNAASAKAAVEAAKPETTVKDTPR
ncbi:MAG TPA: rod shape-determining protein MreC [Terriglobales bacterium]